MKKSLFLLTLLSIFLISCKPATEQEITPQQEFFNKFKELQGMRFMGTETYIKPGVESWAHLELEMYVRECTDSVVYVPFRVGDNHSRTWMFVMEEGDKLRFRHDHRHPDGTEEDNNLYGGYATDQGTEFKQIFPADEFTYSTLERRRHNIWSAWFSEDMSTFTYSLDVRGEHYITIEFDLTNPVTE